MPLNVGYFGKGHTASIDLGVNRSVAVVVGGATFDVTGTNTLTVPGIVSGAAGDALTKTGAGTLTLSDRKSVV